MKFDRETIISEIKSVSSKLNTRRLTSIDFAQNANVSLSTVRYHFGNWTNALLAAGLDPITDEDIAIQNKRKAIERTIDEDILLIELLKLYYKHGKVTDSLINSDGKYSTRPYAKRWGTPKKAFEEALKRKNEGKIDIKEDDLNQEIEKESSKQNCIINNNIEPVINNHNKKRKTNEVFGQPIDFRGLRFAPINEQGVVYLFGMISSEIGFYIESIRTGFPDCEGKRCFDKKNNLWEHVKIEFEFKASNFVQHGHNQNECDVIVCWQNDWKDCPIEIIELKEEIRKLPREITYK